MQFIFCFEEKYFFGFPHLNLKGNFKTLDVGLSLSKALARFLSGILAECIVLCESEKQLQPSFKTALKFTFTYMPATE
jgi:hypothetical protein